MTQEEKYSQLTANEAPAIPRLGIKAYNWWSEGLHGVARDGEATSFPTGLGIAASWNTELVEDVISATSDEAREKFNSGRNTHGLNYWSPTINMARDPRWGRAEETYGEDPYLTSMIADAYIKGLQGDFAATGEYKAIATAKHFLGNSSYVLIGDLGNEVVLGDYSTDRPENTVSPEKGIRRLLKDISKDIDFTYIEGSSHKEYLMNSKNLKLLDKNGNVIQHYTYTDGLKTSTIRFEGNGRTYQYFKGDITYPFGYGLSYTEFEYSNLSIDKTEVTPNDSITVTFEVTNTGDIDGMEAAQLYISAPEAEGRPIKQLKGFDKKLIKAGDTERFELTVNASDLWFWDDVNSCQTYDEGIYTLCVGGDGASCENMSVTFTLSGKLDAKLKTVRIIPSGHVLEKGEMLTTETTAVFNDQSYADLKDAKIVYTSSKERVATVDNEGNVTAAGKGVATITVSVTIDGITRTDSFAVSVK